MQIGKECLLALADPASGLATGTGKTPAEAIQDMEAKGAEKTKELVSRGREKGPASGLGDGAACACGLVLAQFCSSDRTSV